MFERDEIVNNKLMQQNGTKEIYEQAWLDGNGHLLGIMQGLKFDHADKWNMHKSESVQENKAHYILWDFEIKSNHLIQRLSRFYRGFLISGNIG